MPPTAVGPRIRTLRLQRRLTLKDVADKAGITPSALSQIERDHSNPTLGTLKAISSALGTTIGHLFPSTSASDRLGVRPEERSDCRPAEGSPTSC
jgi:transcriptional regulator with XRE-family HTH domain